MNIRTGKNTNLESWTQPLPSEADLHKTQTKMIELSILTTDPYSESGKKEMGTSGIKETYRE